MKCHELKVGMKIGDTWYNDEHPTGVGKVVEILKTRFNSFAN